MSPNFFLKPIEIFKTFFRKEEKFTRQTNRTYQLFAAAIFAIIIHNLIYGLFGYEEPIFFSLFFLLLLAFGLSLVHNVYTYKAKGEPHDLWKLSWLGLLGLLGFHSRLGHGFYGFFGFFAFFGLRKK